MSKRHRQTLFIFRRDLRVADNTALLEALRLSESVIPAFIFDPRQIEPHPYRSLPALNFMLTAISDLAGQLAQRRARLLLFRGDPAEVVAQLLSELPIDAVFVNRDYTPYAVKRDESVRCVCAARGVRFLQHADALLHEPEAILKADGMPYTIYTAFARKASEFPVELPRDNSSSNYYVAPSAGELSGVPDILSDLPGPAPVPSSGRSDALNLLGRLTNFTNYARLRDFPAEPGSTGLSVHLKFGTISVREAYHAIAATLGSNHPLISQLLWRDFFTHIAAHFPHVFEGSFHRKYDRLEWRSDDCAFERWCTGQTGFPLVDAGMRQLNETGFMHNRVRMVTASFLVKDLHMDWRLGEKYFAQHLVDYDPAVNNGNWQWAASTGCDAVPYFRIFSPHLQLKRFDPQCVYVRRWVPELKNATDSEIHSHDSARIAGYVPAMVEHQLEAEIARQMFSRLRETRQGVTS
jgi:deoxyribodipyrimidine photo-lyase